MVIETSDTKLIQPFIKKLTLPKRDSHKGQNGKVLIIGGSSLFHAASLWAAEIASHFVDIVHYSSTKENEEIFLLLKKKFHNGIIVSQKDLLHYVKEDDAVLVGPGMVRAENSITNYQLLITNFNDVLKIKDEAAYTYYLTKYLIENFPDKKFVFDAGSLQMMKKEWLLNLQQPPIITPHQIEFKTCFNISINQYKLEEKVEIVKKTAKEYHCVILLKAIIDIISDGKEVYVVEGGNAGLTKGGTGDMLAGITVSLYAKNEALESAIIASYLLKKTADILFEEKGYWYNIDDIIQTVPKTLKKLT
jgi:NAD(P)H-hydrate epimerase